MTTFQNNAKYAELLLSYLDVAIREDNPLTMGEVLRAFIWRFKGGSLSDASCETRLQPLTTGDSYPDALSNCLASEGTHTCNYQALERILIRRKASQPLRSKGAHARIGTYLMLTSSYGMDLPKVQLYSGMKSIYHVFSKVWEWSHKPTSTDVTDLLDQVKSFSREMAVSGAAVSHMHVPTVVANHKAYAWLLDATPVAGLLLAVTQLKRLIMEAGSKTARQIAYAAGKRQRDAWESAGFSPPFQLIDEKENTQFLAVRVGPLMVRVSQRCALVGVESVRYAMSMSDMERLHQLTMSTVSAIIGVAAQATSGTTLQRSYAKKAVDVTLANISRIVASSKLVALGEEVLVCKGYHRAYTALLGHLAGPLCTKETEGLIDEARKTAPAGVLDIDGFLSDAKTLDAAGALSACNIFKICPAPDACPGLAMIHHIKQIGDCNIADPEMMEELEVELRTQILRAHIRHHKERLKLRTGVERPQWYTDYMMGRYERVPSSEIHHFLAWEGTAIMPHISPYDPKNWKDSRVGADSIKEADSPKVMWYKKNMLTRLLFDDDYPMPGNIRYADEHVIKFFVKAEGHKDPARGIFSANLTDRQAQSWMERAVDKVAREHPSYMIGQPMEVKEARVIQMTAKPTQYGYLALYYGFDISGWFAKMPAEPQRISYAIWAQLFDSELFRKATLVNENAYIYVDIDGYFGAYTNTASNLEGFNGKEMSMVLVAMLSISVRRWRQKVVTKGLMTTREAEGISALLSAYIDGGLSRIDLPAYNAEEAFGMYKETVIETFAACGFSVEVTKCFPSDRFAIFLNEVYLAGRHVAHGVRAAISISAEPTERHTSLIERTGSVATGCRGAVMAGLAPQSATFLMAFHVYLHLIEWVKERDPVVLAAWAYCPRAWGGLGLPSMLQLFTSDSGSAFEEGVATLQSYARLNVGVMKIYINLCRAPLMKRDAVDVLTDPLGGKPLEGYMVDSRVARAVTSALTERSFRGTVSKYAKRLLQFGDAEAFSQFAKAVVPLGQKVTLQEQMLINIAESHPHSIFSAFARRLEKSKSTTLLKIIGREAFSEIVHQNRNEPEASVVCLRRRLY